MKRLILAVLIILSMAGLAWGQGSVTPSRTYAPFLKLGRGTPGSTVDTLTNPSGVLNYNGAAVALVTGTVATSSNLVLNPAPANLGYNGEYWTATAGENLTIGQVCYQGPDGKWWKAIGNLPAVWILNHAYTVGTTIKPTANQNFFLFCSAISGTGTSGGTEPTWAFTLGSTAPGGTIVDNAGANQVTWTYIDTESMAGRMMATGTINAGATGTFLKKGFLRYDSWVDPASSAAYVVGQTLYLYQTAGGGFTQVRPVASGNRVQILGRAATQANTIFFDPNTVIAQVP